jgi:tetratricopeptide (TPR) repeat protein
MSKRLRKKPGAPDVRPAVRAAEWLAPWTVTWRWWLPRVLLIAGLTLAIYWPALRGGFVWDDGWYLTTNPLLDDASGLWKFWFQPGAWVEYYPLQETVQWIQWQLWHSDTLGYHLTNVVLHVINALLVWRLLGKFGLRRAWIGGLIFAVQPVQVESVAYISELKNVLSLPFFLLAMDAWMDHEATGSPRDYRRAFGFFTVAMLCKISMAPFPAAMLLYAWWKRGHVRWADAKAAAPFLLVAAVLSYASIWAGGAYLAHGHDQSPASPLDGPLSRVDAAGLNAAVYFGRFFLPVDSLLVYPQWPLHPGHPVEYTPWLVGLGVLVVLWMKRASWGRHVLLGLGFFFIFLLPFLGFMSVSYMDFTWVMDHFLYIPSIGLIGLGIAAGEDLDARLPLITRPLAVAVVGAMAWQSHALAGFFVSEEELWSHILQRNPNVWLAHHDLGCNLLDQGRYQEALVQLQEATRQRPDFSDGFYNLGVVLGKLGRTAEAEAQYREALRINPQNTRAFLNLGESLLRSGRTDEAESLFREGLKIEPDDASLNTNLGGLLMTKGRTSEAIALYERAVALDPKLAQLQYDLGVALMSTGGLTEATEHLQAAAALDPQSATMHENLGVALARQGRLGEAIEQFQIVLQLDPQKVEAHDNLALALAQTGHVDEAIEQFRQSLQINPADSRARDALAKLEAPAKL